jgi:hypothetical protein
MPIDDAIEDLPKTLENETTSNQLANDRYINCTEQLAHLAKRYIYLNDQSTLANIRSNEFIIYDVSQFKEDFEEYKQIREPLLNIIGYIRSLDIHLNNFKNFIKSGTGEISDKFLESNMNTELPNSVHEWLTNGVHTCIYEINSSAEKAVKEDYKKFTKEDTDKDFEKLIDYFNKSLKDIYSEKEIIKLHLTSKLFHRLLDDFKIMSPWKFNNIHDNYILHEKNLDRMEKIIEASPGKRKIRFRVIDVDRNICEYKITRYYERKKAGGKK